MAPVMEIMRAAFDPAYGEAWTSGQCAGILASPGTWLMIAELDGRPAGFALTRVIVDEAELLLIAVHPEARRRGIGVRLIAGVAEAARRRGAASLFLEVRSNNPAIALYTGTGFSKVGERINYYRGANGDLFDAHTYSLPLCP
ncbi:ribosomal protein S18-alanine N-acetyltransferase [Sphingomonas colocasiae]|uniref:[Ribosomal protein bS18]-alanine N-acetyltransferase n=2 Tax=Sphingomonas colocasiae TaxID=1848973 RepID=A0ABS7PVS1_9SPHN|nr:ribosomal protein S18-alanine N-acetyltransferase [Sphingomonas colocasiae]